MKCSMVVASVLVLSAALAPPAGAQFFGGIVYDPTNHVQNVLTATRSLAQINNQIRQLAHEIEMLNNMAKDLTSLPTSIAAQLRAKLQQVDTLLQAANGLSYAIAAINAQYDQIYKPNYGAAPPPSATLLADALAAWHQSREGYKHALLVQASVVQNVRDDIVELDGLIAASQRSAGNLQALQAGNQIAALSAQQMLQIEQLLAAEARAEALERSRQLAERELGRARLTRFLGDRNAYAPGN